MSARIPILEQDSVPMAVLMDDNCRQLVGLRTTNQLCAVFNRSWQTINHWRKFEGLPYILVPGDIRPSIRYDWAEVQTWAREKKKELHNESSGSRETDKGAA